MQHEYRSQSCIPAHSRPCCSPLQPHTPHSLWTILRHRSLLLSQSLHASNNSTRKNVKLQFEKESCMNWTLFLYTLICLCLTSTAKHQHDHQHIMANKASLNGGSLPAAIVHMEPNTMPPSSLQIATRLLLQLSVDGLHAQRVLRGAAKRLWESWSSW